MAVLKEWNAVHDRRLKLVLQMEEIEREGKTPIVVAAQDYVRKNLVPKEVLRQIEQ